MKELRTLTFDVTSIRIYAKNLNLQNIHLRIQAARLNGKPCSKLKKQGQRKSIEASFIAIIGPTLNNQSDTKSFTYSVIVSLVNFLTLF